MSSSATSRAMASRTSWGSPPTSVQYWESSGGRRAHVHQHVVGAQTNATSVALGDVNGDERLDIVVSNGAAMATPGLQVFTRATPTAAFAPTVIRTRPAPRTWWWVTSMATARDEIFSGERNFGALVAYWTWTGSAFERHVISTAFESTWTHRLELADMDSDGDLDWWSRSAPPWPCAGSRTSTGPTRAGSRTWSPTVGCACRGAGGGRLRPRRRHRPGGGARGRLRGHPLQERWRCVVASKR
jgi:hypothetical protein